MLLQDDIVHEAQTMKSYNHPNVLSLYTSFVHNQDLWMITPFMSGGSILHIMKYRFPKVCCAVLWPARAHRGQQLGQQQQQRRTTRGSPFVRSISSRYRSVGRGVRSPLH